MRRRQIWLVPILASGFLGCLAAAGSPSSDTWRTEAEKAGAALEAGDRATARRHLHRAIEEAEQQGAPAVERARLFAQLAKAHGEEGDYPPAVQAYRQALDLAEEAPINEDVHLLRAEILTELGNIYFPLRRPQDGVEALEEALRSYRQVLDPTAPEVIKSLELLGVAYGEANDLVMAVRLLREAADLVSRSPTATLEEKAGPLFSLADILKRQGRHAEAAEVTERALRLMDTNGN